MNLFDIIVVYVKALQTKGRDAAEAAVKDQDPVIVQGIRSSFNDKGKLIKGDGSQVTLASLLMLGIKSPL